MDSIEMQELRALRPYLRAPGIHYNLLASMVRRIEALEAQLQELQAPSTATLPTTASPTTASPSDVAEQELIALLIRASSPLAPTIIPDGPAELILWFVAPQDALRFVELTRVLAAQPTK